jgi:hypothetical protein
MADIEMDFPFSPAVGQKYTNAIGVVYEWNGYGWVIGFYDAASQAFTNLGELMSQIRILLQDTDTLGNEYRYSDNSIVMNINMGMLEMFRIRPDIFLELGFKPPAYDSAALDTTILIEPQFIPALVYYAVGMCQLRDDESTQDQRASGFLAKFVSMLAAVA